MYLKKTRLTAAAILFYVSTSYAQNATYNVTAVSAQKAVFNNEITTYGQVEADPKNTATIVAPVSGTVQSLKILTGDDVSAGEVVAEISTDPILLAQAKAAADTLSYARESLAHQERLFAQQLATRDQVAAARRDVEIAEANLAAAKRLGSDKAQLKIKAPSGGVVSSVSTAPGQQVVQGTALATVSSPDALLVKAGIEPSDSRLIKPGDAVSVMAVTGPSDDSGDRATFSVSTVGSTVDPQTRLVPITIFMSGHDASNFLVGQTVRVTFHSGQIKSVRVPRTALEYDGDSAIVFLVQSNKAVRQTVKLAGATDAEIFVVEGLRPGDVVITSGLSGLTDGATVNVNSQ